MRIGKLRHRLDLQSVAVTLNSFGESVYTYESYDTVWGALSPLSGLELEAGRQIHAEVQHKAVIRYNADVKPTDRIATKGRSLEVVAVLNDDERDVMQTLLLTEVV